MPGKQFIDHNGAAIFILRLYAIYARSRVILVGFMLFLISELTLKIVGASLIDTEPLSDTDPHNA